MEVVRGVRLFVIAVIFALGLSFSSYASSFEGSTKDVSGAGTSTWEEAKKAIENRLNASSSAVKRDITVGYKEGSYLIYVCATHGQSFSDYSAYAERFRQDYIDNGAGEKDFYVLEYESVYNEKVDAYKKVMGKMSTGRTLIADTGFKVGVNDVPFKNICFNEFSKDGSCSGFTFLEMAVFLGDSNIKKPMDFTNSVNSVSKYKGYEGFKQSGTKVDISGFDFIKTKNINAYVPDSEFMKEKDIKTYKDKSTKIDHQKWSKKVEASKIQGTKDYDFARALSYFWAYASFNEIDEIQRLEALGNCYNTSFNCPSNELDMVIDELKAGRPVGVGFVMPGVGGHSVLGYKLEQDKKDKNMYYLSVHDSNFPSNIYITKNNTQQKVDPVVCIYISEYYGKDALWFYYSPFGVSDNLRNEYKFTEMLRFSTADGRLLHTNNYVEHWGEKVQINKYKY